MWTWVKRLFGVPTITGLEGHSPADKVIPAIESSNSLVSTSSHKNFDDGLLDSAKQHWQFGQWSHLIRLAELDLVNHPDRAKLALLIASGLAQTGDERSAREWVLTAKQWGCSQKLINQVLISGVQNHLAQASFCAGNEAAASNLLNEAVKTVMPQLDSQLLTHARLSTLGDQVSDKIGAAQLQFSHNHLNRTHDQPVAVSQPAQPKELAPKLLAEFNLGEAWAGNTVNTVIFRHHGIFTHQGHQFTSFYVDEHTLRFVCRRLSDDHITHYDLAGEYNLKDAHNSISMGVDRQGYLHACFDHHASKLRYRRSLQPMSIDGWTDDMPMTGQHEDKVTYPTFILPRAGYPLTLLYRDGTRNKGSARLKYYDEQSQGWRDKPTAILSGAEQKPWTSNAYWNHPAIGHDGSLHLSFVWRTGVLGDEQLVNNINIGYAWSPDNGHHWYTLQGQPYQLPITPTTAETIWPVPPGRNLINQCSMALDRFNRPHIVFYANDADGIPQYQHLRHDGKRWHHQMLSQRTEPFNLAGGGTLQIPISRPDVLMDANDNAVVVFRGDLTNNCMSLVKLCPPFYEAAEAQQHTLVEQALGFAEPMLDREGWKLHNKLGLLLQHNAQPNHDVNPVMQSSAIRISEFEL